MLVVLSDILNVYVAFIVTTQLQCTRLQNHLHSTTSNLNYFSLPEQNIVMIAIDVFFSLIITVFGLEHVLARITIVDSGGMFVERQLYASGRSPCTLTTWITIYPRFGNVNRWRNAIIILLLVVLTIFLIFVLLLLLFHSYLITTNQTTYEFVRRRRIPYMKNIPDQVHPFSRGMCRNIYNVCCGNYNLEREPVHTAYETERK